MKKLICFSAGAMYHLVKRQCIKVNLIVSFLSACLFCIRQHIGIYQETRLLLVQQGLILANNNEKHATLTDAEKDAETIDAACLKAKKLHEGCSLETDANGPEANYLRQIAEKVLNCVLQEQDAACSGLYSLLTEVGVFRILFVASRRLSPTNINQWIGKLSKMVFKGLAIYVKFNLNL